MSANIYWSPPTGRKRVTAGAPSKFLATLSLIGAEDGAAEEHVGALLALAEISSDADGYIELVNAIRQHGHVSISVEY